MAGLNEVLNESAAQRSLVEHASNRLGSRNGEHQHGRGDREAFSGARKCPTEANQLPGFRALQHSNMGKTWTRFP